MEEIPDTLRLTGEVVIQCGNEWGGGPIGIDEALSCDACDHSDPDASQQKFHEAAEADSDPHSFKRWLLCDTCMALIVNRDAMPLDWRQARFRGCRAD